MLYRKDTVSGTKKIHLGRVPFSHHNTSLVTKTKGHNSDIKMLNPSFEAVLNELWQSLRNINVLQDLWGLPSNRTQREKVMDLFKCTVMRMLCH